MAGDLRSLGASYPALAQAVRKLQGGLDLLQAHRQVSAGGGLGAPCSLLRGAACTATPGQQSH